MKYLFLFFCLLHSQINFAQNCVLNGKVIDAEAFKSVPYANIVDLQHKNGIEANLEGEFRLSLKSLPTTLKVSFVGYKTKEIYLEKCPSGLLKIELQEAKENLNEVVIRPTENPAWSIIRKVQENKSRNNPAQIEAYSLQQYQKFLLGPDSSAIESAKESYKKRALKKKLNIDSAMAAMPIPLSKLFLIENASEVDFLRPGPKTETVKKTFSSLPPAYTMLLNSLPADIIPFGLYEDQIPINIFKMVCLSPLSSNTFRLYDLELRDTLFNAQDTTFVITFVPQKGKKFNGFKGALFVNSDGWAVEKFSAAVADTFQLAKFRFVQKSEKVAGRWFPTENMFALNWPIYGKKGGLDVEMYQYADSVRFNSKKTGGLASDYARIVPQDAFAQTEEEFIQFRQDSLKATERLAIDFLKTGNKVKLGKTSITGYEYLDKVGNGVQFFMNNVLHTGPVEWRLTEFLKRNQLEGWRPGFWVQNNQNNFPRLSASANLAYGLRDKELKWGVNSRFDFNKKRNAGLILGLNKFNELRYRTEFMQPNYSFLGLELARNIYENRDLPSQRRRVANAGLFFKPWAFTRMQVQLRQNQVELLNNSGFLPRQIFNTAELVFDTRIAWKEQMVRTGRIESNINRWGSVWNLNIVKGLKNSTLRGEYDYLRTAVEVTQSLRMKRLGIMSLTASYGKLWGEVPPNAYFSPFSANSFFNASANGSVLIGDFLFNQYVRLGISQNFGRNLIRTQSRYFQPQLILGGRLTIGNRIDQVEAGKELVNGIYELNTRLDNLFRYPILGAYLGLGVNVSTQFGAKNPVLDRNKFLIRPSLSLGF